ncbi:ankyrin repeat-containing protein BDA1-like [Humulus lupulus]|uniref:ankyrin repeat-containing protein BDA1-like n=1 Tax=Humulus lupulus TaxID=3486 RepID=UPI002B407FAC|nr:ankyrin repeat-containing protein BDA1-like [Humulus lupulus]
MEKSVEEAAMKGSVKSLLKLLNEDPQILNNQSHPNTPLHTASLLGHSAFAKELLSRAPQLAPVLNSQGYSSLHLAAAKGSVEIVKILVRVDSDLCLVRDRDGRIPLHLGVLKGKVAAVGELARVRPESGRVLTRGGDSAYHLCVKHSRLEALKVLVDVLGENDESVNFRDCDGNSVLHVAVSKKQLEMINYLVFNTKVEVNAQNSNGLTALDLLFLGYRDTRDMAIKETLQKAGAQRNTEASSTSYYPDEDTMRVITSSRKPLTSQKSSSKKPKQVDWLGRRRSSLMVVASLIATVAFQAAISPPGGVWQEDYLVDSDGKPVEDPHNAGKSVMADSYPFQYGQFMIMNTIAFLSSLSIILLLVSGLPLRQRRWMWLQMVIMWIAITSLSGTCFVGLIYMTPESKRGVLYNVTRVSVLVWLPLMGVIFGGNVVRMIRWFLIKHGYIKETPPKDGDLVGLEYDDDEEL